MSFFRIKTVKGKQYLYKQTSVRDGEKVRSIMEYWGRVDGRDNGIPAKNRNGDLQTWSHPKRPDYTVEHRRELFKTNRSEFERLRAFDAQRAKSSKESKSAWKEKSLSRAEKQERAAEKQASEAKHQETMDALQGFKDMLAEKGLGPKV